MNFFERKPAEIFPDKILGKQECNLPDIPLPISESEYFRTKSVCASPNGPPRLDLAKSRPINTQEFTPAVETNSDIHRLEHIETGPHVSTIPGDDFSFILKTVKEKISVWWHRHRHLRDAEFGDWNCRRRRVVADTFAD